MTSDAPRKGFQTPRHLPVEGPEFMPGLTGGFAQHLESCGRAHSALCHSRVRQKAQHAELYQRIRGPRPVTRLGEPGVRRGVALVARPEQREKNVHVHQLPVHSSSRSSRTFSVVIRGKLSGASNTGMPFTFLVPIW